MAAGVAWIPVALSAVRVGPEARWTTRAQRQFRPLQWIGTKIAPGRCPSLTRPAGWLRRGRADAREMAVGYAEARRIAGVDLDVRLGQVRSKPRALAGPRHGVPLVANATGIEAKRKELVRCDRRRADRDEVSPGDRL